MFLVLLSFEKLQEFQEFCGGKWRGQGQCRFSIISGCLNILVMAFQHLNFPGIGVSCLFSVKLQFSCFLIMDNFWLDP